MFLIFLVCIATTFLYFLPTIVATSRNHLNVVAIALLNLLLGWTFIGWVAALVWSVTVQASGARPLFALPAAAPKTVSPKSPAKSLSKPKKRSK